MEGLRPVCMNTTIVPQRMLCSNNPYWDNNIAGCTGVEASVNRVHLGLEGPAWKKCRVQSKETAVTAGGCIKNNGVPLDKKLAIGNVEYLPIHLERW